ncbi:hypothetical protein B0T18DRAFT_418274 [Schizothecium vesticola]|uniref:Uncharacterized protein n=1 Tax=Schizothecium vesticola TaxID=314040 RepID=A0AA40EJN7_9PEZI|nr:hypothetical protein B0T18DRAFT_418274 [Schizothecium vesticola]
MQYISGPASWAVAWAVFSKLVRPFVYWRGAGHRRDNGTSTARCITEPGYDGDRVRVGAGEPRSRKASRAGGRPSGGLGLDPLFGVALSALALPPR